MLTVQQISKILGISRHRLLRLRRQGQFCHPCKIVSAHKTYWDMATVKEWAENSPAILEKLGQS